VGAYIGMNGSSGSVAVNTNATTNVGFSVRLAASQTADALQIQNSAATNLVRVEADGLIRTNAGVIATGNYLNSFGGAVISNTIVAVRPNASNIGLGIQAAASQTADLLRVTDSTATTLTAIKSTGEITAPLATLTATSASVVPLTVTGASGQTANFFEVKNNSGTILTRVSSTGSIRTAAIGSNVDNLPYIATNYDNNSVGVVIVAPAQKGLTVRGAASQTASLQEWQNSAGSILARVDSAGQIISTVGIFAGGGLVSLSSNQSGGVATMTRATAAATNPGANNARIYFRDGTTAGTLKLVVRAGASGAETTILDNIPQT